MDKHKDKLETIRRHIRSYPDFPKPGILYRDVFSVLREPTVFRTLLDVMIEHVAETTPRVQRIVGLDSRGFLFGPPIALHLDVPFVPVRKKGKLPGKVRGQTYGLEYGEDEFEMQEDSVEEGDAVVIVDDLLATGGSLSAACKLVETLGGRVAECLVVMELTDLKGRDNVSSPVHSLIKY